MREGITKYGVAAMVVVLASSILAVTGLAGSGGTDVSRYKVGEFPADIAVGDFNRDGLEDLAVTNFQGDPKTISILRGRSQGRFARAKTIALEVGDQPHGIAVTRIGAGKDQDLVVGTFGDNLLVLKGRKGAGFKSPQQLPIGDEPRQVVAADFNGDGLTDVAASRQSGGDVAVMLGQGGLDFGAPTLYPGASGGPILAAKLDPGNQLDLLTLDFSVDGVSLYRGQAGGSFGAAETLLAGAEPVSLASADLNRDGRRDIVAGLVGDRPRLLVARGQAGGSFAAPKTLRVGPGPMFVQDIAVTRLNRDRDPDLVIVGKQVGGIRAAHRRARLGGGPQPSRVILLAGRGGINLERLNEIKVSGDTNAVAAAHLDRGRRVDVALARARTDKRGHAVVVLDP